MLKVIKIDRLLSQYEAEQLSIAYQEQIDRGVLVLERGASLEVIDPEDYPMIELSKEPLAEETNPMESIETAQYEIPN